MGILFFIPLTLIAIYESTSDKRKHAWMGDWFRGDDEAAEDCPENRDPEVDDPNCEGMKISKVPFEELIKSLPKVDQVSGLLCIFFIYKNSSQMIVDIFFFFFFFSVE